MAKAICHIFAHLDCLLVGLGYTSGVIEASMGMQPKFMSKKQREEQALLRLKEQAEAKKQQ